MNSGEMVAQEARERRGRKVGLVDAQPARERLAMLAEYGIGWKRASRLAGVPEGTVSKLLYGMPGFPPSRRINAGMAERILAVRPRLADIADCAVIDGTGTRRRLRALAARGFPLAYMADRLGVHQSNLVQTRRSGRVLASSARKVAALYEELWDQDPAAHGVGARASTYARNHAARHGWLPPMAWGEDIDDPGFEPAPPERARTALGVAEEADLLRTGGATDEEIAVRLGMSRGDLRTYLTRARKYAAATAPIDYRLEEAATA